MPNFVNCTIRCVPGTYSDTRGRNRSGKMNPKILIEGETVRSLYLEMYFEVTRLAVGTGFVVQSRIGPVLVTNRHNVTGLDNQTHKPLHSQGGIPDRLIIHHNQLGKVGSFVLRTEMLHDQDGTPLWIEHPSLGATADFVALPLKSLEMKAFTDNVQLYPWSLDTPDPQIQYRVTDTVSVVGFPFGLRSSNLAIWATGFIATEPMVDHDGLPLVLIDCRARKGQSGSPVVAFRTGMVPLTNGDSVLFSNPVSNLVGIYSGRVNPESDLGYVWKRNAIKDLVDSL